MERCTVVARCCVCSVGDELKKIERFGTLRSSEWEGNLRDVKTGRVHWFLNHKTMHLLLLLLLRFIQHYSDSFAVVPNADRSIPPRLCVCVCLWCLLSSFYPVQPWMRDVALQKQSMEGNDVSIAIYGVYTNSVTYYKRHKQSPILLLLISFCNEHVTRPIVLIMFDFCSHCEKERGKKINFKLLNWNLKYLI